MCQSCPAKAVFTAEHFPMCQFCSSGPGCDHPGMMDSFKMRGLWEVPAVQVHIGSAWLNHPSFSSTSLWGRSRSSSCAGGRLWWQERHRSSADMSRDAATHRSHLTQMWACFCCVWNNLLLTWQVCVAPFQSPFFDHLLSVFIPTTSS